MSGDALQNSSQIPVAIKLVTQSQSSVDKTLSLYENASANTHSDLCRRFAQAHKSALPPTDSVEADDMSWRNVDGLNRGQHEIFEKLMRTIAHGNRQILQVVQGGPGTGKTFLMNTFIEKCKLVTKKGAYTGIAASLISGRTLHSLFGLSRASYSDGVARDGSTPFQESWSI